MFHRFVQPRFRAGDNNTPRSLGLDGRDTRCFVKRVRIEEQACLGELLQQNGLRHAAVPCNAGLIGGGSYPRPGEVSLAHGGVLFLDELPEFRKNVLEVLRQPMEDGVVTIARAAMSLTYPARFMLAAAMNPCPCGYFGDPQHNCVCGPLGVERYLARVSGPLLDRIDIHLEVPAVKYRALADQGHGEPSEPIRERVDRARAVQRDRFAARPGVYANAHMAPRDIRTFCRVSDGADALLRTAITRLALSARAYHRILKIARTIADLEGAADLQPKHVSEAIQYRSLDRRGLG